MVIDFVSYRQNRIAELEAAKNAQQAEIARRTRLEMVLSDLLAELEAA